MKLSRYPRSRSYPSGFASGFGPATFRAVQLFGLLLAPLWLAWGLVDVVAKQGGLDAAVEHTVSGLLECGTEALRAQKALLRQWEELPLTESVNLSVGVFGKSFLTGEPQRLMQGFLDRKK